MHVNIACLTEWLIDWLIDWRHIWLAYAVHFIKIARSSGVYCSSVSADTTNFQLYWHWWSSILSELLFSRRMKVTAASGRPTRWDIPSPLSLQSVSGKTWKSSKWTNIRTTVAVTRRKRIDVGAERVNYRRK